jgi:hypothetical protein
MADVASFDASLNYEADATFLVEAAEKFPNVKTLSLVIGKLGDWDNQMLASFGKVENLHFSLSTAAEADAPLQGVCKETMDLILAVPQAMPTVKTINSLPATELDPSRLGVNSMSTRKEIEWEAAVSERKTALDDWKDEVLAAKYPAGAPTDTIPGPAVIESEENGDSVEDGVRVHPYQGIPAAKLCTQVEGCVSVVTVGFREGGTSGSYTPVGGGAVAFTGSFGETTETIYNASTKLTSGPIVVAKTDPPQTVSSKSEAVGSANYDAAFAWIASHTTG